MSVYDYNGASLTSLRDYCGNEKTVAYDYNGNVILEEDQTDVSSVKVMTYNVGGWYTGTGVNVPANERNTYYNLHKSIIDTVDADIIQLQEYWDEFSDNGDGCISLFSAYPYMARRQATTQYYGHAIFSKYPILTVHENAFSNNAQRYYDDAVLSIGDKTVHCINTHLNPGSGSASARAEQIVEIIDYIDTLTESFILTGDLNVTCDGNTSNEDYINVIAPMLSKGWNVANCDSSIIYTYIGTEEQFPTDNIISDMTISGVYRETTKLTDDIDATVDHVPLVATISISEE